MQGDVSQGLPPSHRCADPINDTQGRYLITVKLEPKHNRKRSLLVGSRWNQSNPLPFVCLCNEAKLHSQAEAPPASVTGAITHLETEKR